jgi:hypothetical protein
VSEALDISPAELAADIINRLALPGLAPAGAIVGPTNDVQNQEGAVSCMASGLPVVELYVPLQWMRCQMRCIAGTLDTAEQISQKAFRLFQAQNRIIAYQASTGNRYLIHATKVTAGPSMHYDSPETWETLLFAEMMIATDHL